MRPSASPQINSTFLNADAVAEKLGMARATLMRRRVELEERIGLPRPVGWSLRPLLWRKDQFEYWFNQQGLPKDYDTRGGSRTDKRRES